MEHIQELAERNQQRAKEIIQETKIVDIWKSVNAEVHLVGSLRMGLLIKHKDIDLHIYSSPLTTSNSFAAMAKLAENPNITKIQCTNLLYTEEKCIDWHAYYRDKDNEIWQIDMIHILKNSRYDGFFEDVADRIIAALTPETKNTILQLKYDTPEQEKIMGIEYYQAVIQDNIKTYSEFTEWRKKTPYYQYRRMETRNNKLNIYTLNK